MNPLIQIRHDKERGCGWRKAGGLYLVAGGTGLPCGKLPIPLERCPTCSAGIKPARGWTWINADAINQLKACSFAAEIDGCDGCIFASSALSPVGQVGLLWVGGEFYKTPDDWMKETKAQGISRRIPALPNGFKLGQTWVYVAHREAIRRPDLECGETAVYRPGIIQAFMPRAVEYVTKGNESDAELENLVKRGITPVAIERDLTDQTTTQGGDHGTRKQTGSSASAPVA